MSKLAAICTLSALLSTAACVTEEDWLDGTEEPSDDGRADGNGPLTIFLSETQTSMKRILDGERLGTLERDRTGTLAVDGRNLSEGTVLVFNGTLHAYDGTVQRHRFVIDPWHVLREQGAANPGGFLWVDFANDPTHANAAGQNAFGKKAGIFRGEIVATNALPLGQAIPADLRSLYIRPQRLGERPPNLIRDAEILIQPNIALAELLPDVGGADPCLGEKVIDQTILGQKLRIKAAVEGFPANSTLRMEVTYTTPRNTSRSIAGAAWDWVTSWVSDTATIETQLVNVTAATGRGTVTIPSYQMPNPGFGADVYGMQIQIKVTTDGPSGAFAQSSVHHLLVAEQGKEVVVDQTELCPIGDVACHALRDRDVPDNIVARRNVIENSAQQKGLYNTITRPLGRCSGGDLASVGSACSVYRESSDTQLSAHVRAELEFELNVNGQAQGNASWSGSLPGMSNVSGSASVEAAFQATFNLEADLKAKFDRSVTWRNRSNLDVIYDPTNTQIQWWRVVTPRLRYLKIAKFNACGQEQENHDIYLSDLRDSRLVVACEQVPSATSACHQVEPTAEATAACTNLLIAPTSPRGQMCLAD